MDSKICGVKDICTLSYILNHKFPPKFIGFITNYPKSKRNLDIQTLRALTKKKRANINYVSVLVRPDDKILEKIKNLNFKYYQLYDVNPNRAYFIKKKYRKKIISVITVKKTSDVKKYKLYLKIADIILFDGKGYEKSIGFNHNYLKGVPRSFKSMLAGNIKFTDNLDKFSKITDIIDISGSLETSGKKDRSKIDIFLKNINKIRK